MEPQPPCHQEAKTAPASAQPLLDLSAAFQPSSRRNRNPIRRVWVEHGAFLGLVITTIASSLLLVSNEQNWTNSREFYRIVNEYRATTQIIVQILSNIFGVMCVTVVCRLMHHAVRLRFQKKQVSLDVLRLWSDFISPRMDWDLPLKFIIPLLGFIAICSIPSALWAGAMTPINTFGIRIGSIDVPSFSNAALVKEYPSEIGRNGPVVRDRRGLFTYSVGTMLLGSLLASAASATTVDGSIRQHPKLDYSRFTYSGRSYGAGASAGIMDDGILDKDSVLSYSYLEPGYKTVVNCIYNASTDFMLNKLPQEMLFSASGNLPNSAAGEPEYSVYVGHSSAPIVAIGVSHTMTGPDRILGIAAGHGYVSLNATQCSLDFIPTLFKVSIGVAGRNITVTPIGSTVNIEQTGMLTFAATRQFELISNDLTSIYTSLLGDSLNASISAYNTSIALVRSRDPPSEPEATLAGLTNAIAAMIDDMLVAYASAQLVIANEFFAAETRVQFKAIRLGQPGYIYAVVGLNALILLLFAAEASRTKGWRSLPRFDLMDPRSLIIGSSMGGKGIGGAAIAAHEESRLPAFSLHHKRLDFKIGKLPVAMSREQDFAIVLGEVQIHHA